MDSLCFHVPLQSLSTHVLRTQHCMKDFSVCMASTFLREKVGLHSCDENGNQLASFDQSANKRPQLPLYIHFVGMALDLNRIYLCKNLHTVQLSLKL